MGCLCHLIDNTSHKGLVGFTRAIKFDREDFCIDIYFYFDKSTKQKNVLQSYAEFYDKKYCDILKHAGLAWKGLSKEFCCNVSVYKVILKVKMLKNQLLMLMV